MHNRIIFSDSQKNRINVKYSSQKSRITAKLSLLVYLRRQCFFDMWGRGRAYIRMLSPRAKIHRMALLLRREWRLCVLRRLRQQRAELRLCLLRWLFRPRSIYPCTHFNPSWTYQHTASAVCLCRGLTLPLCFTISLFCSDFKSFLRLFASPSARVFFWRNDPPCATFWAW